MKNKNVFFYDSELIDFLSWIYNIQVDLNLSQHKSIVFISKLLNWIETHIMHIDAFKMYHILVHLIPVMLTWTYCILYEQLLHTKQIFIFYSIINTMIKIYK